MPAQRMYLFAQKSTLRRFLAEGGGAIIASIPTGKPSLAYADAKFFEKTIAQ